MRVSWDVSRVRKGGQDRRLEDYITVTLSFECGELLSEKIEVWASFYEWTTWTWCRMMHITQYNLDLQNEFWRLCGIWCMMPLSYLEKGKLWLYAEQNRKHWMLLKSNYSLKYMKKIRSKIWWIFVIVSWNFFYLLHYYALWIFSIHDLWPG